MRELISRAVPDVTPRELRHFVVLAVCVGALTLAELRESLRGSQRAHKAARALIRAKKKNKKMMSTEKGAVRDVDNDDDATSSSSSSSSFSSSAATADIIGLEEVLGRLDARLTAERVEPRALFDQFDGDKDGKLDAAELKAGLGFRV